MGLVFSGNIAASGRFDAYEDFLVSQIDSEDPSSRLLAQFIVTELLPAVKPDQQVRLASGIIGKIDRSAYMQSLANARDGGDADVAVIMEKAYIKPSHQKTAALVQDALLSSLCTISLPTTIGCITLQDNSFDTVQELSRILYRICNSDRVPEDRAKSSLQNLFAQIGHRCLVFLLGVALDKSESLELRVVSIRHIQAFITAHAAEGGKLQTDFQCIIPALLILLIDKEKKIREVTCFTLRLLRAGSGGVVQSVYGIDDIYGDATRSVQILQPKDLTQYLDDIVASATDITADGSVLQTLHTRLLNAEHNESKKATAYVDTTLGASGFQLIWICSTVTGALSSLSSFPMCRDGDLWFPEWCY